MSQLILINLLSICLLLLIYRWHTQGKAAPLFIMLGLIFLAVLKWVLVGPHQYIIRFILVNAALISLQLLNLYALLALRKRRFIRLIPDYFKAGDALFWLWLVGSFSPINFLFFYILSFPFSLVFSRLSPKGDNGQKIALTGTQALLFALVLMAEIALSSFGAFDDTWFFKLW